MVYAEITLTNAAELTKVSIQEQLDLSFIEKRKAVMAGGSVKEYDVARPIMIKFANRTATCNAFVLQGNNEPLPGVIPMEEMDVVIHPQRQELIVNPEYAQLSMKQTGVLFLH